MRIALFGQTGPYAPPALRQLLAVRGDFHIGLVVEGKRRSGRAISRLLPPHPAALPSGDSLSALAQAAGIPVLVTSDVNGSAARRIITRHSPDWLVCVGFDRLFTPALLACGRLGGINAHPSRLPELRGPSPLFWTLKEGRRSSAVTLHALDEREDHGPIYAQESFVWGHRQSGADIYAIAGELAGRMLAQLLARARLGGLTAMPQDHLRASRAPRPKPEDAFVEPSTWRCEALVDFACGAPFFRAPWLRLGEDTFFVRCGIAAEPGRNIPGHYVLQGSTLVVQCKDGLAHLEIQV